MHILCSFSPLHQSQPCQKYWKYCVLLSLSLCSLSPIKDLTGEGEMNTSAFGQRHQIDGGLDFVFAGMMKLMEHLAR